MDSTPSYEAQWNEYRKRRLVFVLLAATYIPAQFVISLPLSRALGSDSVIPIVAVLWIAAFGVAGMRLSRWPCPRCGKPFHLTQRRYKSFARKCVHCGLPKWSTNPEG